MEGSICITRADRKTLLKLCRSGENVRTARHAQIILLRNKGWTWAKIREASFCSNDLIRAALKTYENHGVAGLAKPAATAAIARRVRFSFMGLLDWSVRDGFGYSQLTRL